MKFSECVISARDQGVLSKEEAEDLIKRYEAHRKARAAAGEADPEGGAKAGLAADLAEEAARRKYVAQLATEKRDEIAGDLESFRDVKDRPNVFEAAMRKLENFGFSGFSSVRGRMLSIVSLAHSEMAEVLRTFERNTITGFHHSAAEARAVVREILGESTGNPVAAAMAKAVSHGFELLRSRFNAAGGHIGEIAGGYIPQFHDPLAVLRAGFEKWRDTIVPKLAVDKIRDPVTGLPISKERLDEALKVSYGRITTGGWNEREPAAVPFGKGALANQRADHRFFVFKSADDWLDYAASFGKGDPINAIFEHVNGMARDIAALEVLGPNPGAMVEWLKQVVQHEHAKALGGGEDTLFRLANWSKSGEKDAGKVAADRIDALWQNVRGRPVVSGIVSKAAGDIRNVLTSIQLGSAAITAATTDPALDKAARAAIGMPLSWMFGSNAKVYLDGVANLMSASVIGRPIAAIIDHMTGAPREQALRSGMIMDSFLHMMGEEARYAGTLGGNVWSRWLTERTINLSGLGPMTEARRSVFGLDFQAFLADFADKALPQLPERLRAKMEGYGVTPEIWDAMRATPLKDGLLRPSDVALKDRAAAERYLEMILGETERAVPTSNLRAKAYWTGGGPRGTARQELADSFLQYRSFALSLMANQMEAIAQETANIGRASGASYAAQLLVLTTIGGAAALQLKQIANGRDPQNIKDARFWMQALTTGGGLGLYGDFLFADVNRYGQSFGEQLAGPTIGALNDVLHLGPGALQQVMQGKPTDLGKKVPDFIARHTPLLTSLWYTRLLYKRELTDQLQYLLDPQAHRRWREEERKAMRERGQGYWWAPGEPGPSRMPDFGMFGGR